MLKKHTDSNNMAANALQQMRIGAVSSDLTPRYMQCRSELSWRRLALKCLAEQTRFPGLSRSPKPRTTGSHCGHSKDTHAPGFLASPCCQEMRGGCDYSQFLPLSPLPRWTNRDFQTGMKSQLSSVKTVYTPSEFGNSDDAAQISIIPLDSSTELCSTSPLCLGKR